MAVTHHYLLAFTGEPATDPAVTMSGTLDGATEQDIRDGGKTIILTLVNDTWVDGANFNTDRLFILGASGSLGVDGSLATATSWDTVNSSIPATAVVRTSDTVVTITLPALALYDITENETFSFTIPDSSNISETSYAAGNTLEVTFVEEAEEAEEDTGGAGGAGEPGARGRARNFPDSGRGARDFSTETASLKVSESPVKPERLKPVSVPSEEDFVRLEALRETLAREAERISRVDEVLKGLEGQVDEEELALLLLFVELD